jgi:hypothetical protein
MQWLRLYLGQLSKHRVLKKTGLTEIGSLREFVHNDPSAPTRSLPGLVAALAVRSYQLWSYRSERCSFPRGRNCSAVVLKSFRTYGAISGAAVMYLLLVTNKEFVGECEEWCMAA